MVRTAVEVSTPHVLQWGWFSIELANLLIIVTMLVVFGLALVIPFGRGHTSTARSAAGRNGTAAEDGDRP